MARLQRKPAIPSPRAEDHDQRVLIHNVSWEQYEALRAADDRPGLRMTYLEGTLEIMSPSGRHETGKTLIARLIEAYAEERNLDLDGLGSTTFRDKVKERGLEPDECYCLRPPGFERAPDIEDAIPDFAIEVVLSSGGVDKLEVYRGLGVPEVWFFIDGAFYIFHLIDGEYERRERSAFLPDIDLDEIARIVAGTPVHQTRAVRDYRAALRAKSAR